MTNGETRVTGGDLSGTNGGRLEWQVFALVAAVGVLVGVINATSKLMEASGEGTAIDPRQPWAVEFTSIVFILILTPFIGWMVGRFPPRAERWGRFVAAHLAATAAFSAAHVAGMVALRKAVYALAGESYDFTGDAGLLLPLLYEWRKDVLAYAAIAAAYWGWRRWREPPRMPASEGADGSSRKLEIRDGGRVVLVEPADILLLEAAGNYVEIHVAGRTYLARGTLAAFEQKLAGQGFVRIHRSRLLNRARLAGFSPTPSGDLEITLDDGRVVAGSRRFRAVLAAGR